MSVSFTLFLALLAALFYVAAALILKTWAVLPVWLALAGIMAAFSGACVVEMEVLRRARFADVVVLIIAFEVVIAVMLSRPLLGEIYTGRDLVGLVVVVSGLAILLWGAAPQQAVPPAIAEHRGHG